MAHVFVLDSRARRARVQTLPSTHLSDVLQQGCAKLGLKPDQFVLKSVAPRLGQSRLLTAIDTTTSSSTCPCRSGSPACPAAPS
jgi:hypothetical protein